MKYHSTRGNVAGLSFEEAVMMGLASDGGLLVPETWPHFADQLSSWRSLSFVQLAHQVMMPFIQEEIPVDIWHHC